MATNLSIGLYYPSNIIPSDVLDINQLGFITGSQHCYAKQIKEFYPKLALPLRTYLVGAKQLKENKGQDFLRQLLKYDYIPAIKEHSQQGYPVQVVLNELFGIDGSLRHGIEEQTVFTAIDYILQAINSPDIIFNEMNTYRFTQYTGNGLQNNGVLRFIQKVKERYPQINVSLGVQTIGNRLCKDLILASLPILLSHIKNLDWFTFPIHFTEVGYYHEPYNPQQQVAFLDAIKAIAIQYEVSSLCYIYPWDGDYFHLAGQPRNTLCGIWDENWGTKYDILSQP